MGGRDTPGPLIVAAAGGSVFHASGYDHVALLSMIPSAILDVTRGSPCSVPAGRYETLRTTSLE